MQQGSHGPSRRVEEPGHYVYTLAHGDVRIFSKSSDTKPQQQDRTYQVVASNKTINQLQTKEGSDPWVKNDPWGGYTPTSSSAASSSTQSGLTVSQIATIEANIEQKIRSSMDMPMERSGLEERVIALEAKIQQTDAKVGQFQQQMDHHYNSLNTSIESKFNDQMNRLEALLSKRKFME